MDKNWVPIALFIVVGAVIFGYFFFNAYVEKMRQYTLQKALDSDIELTSGFLDSVGKSVDFKTRDFRRGVILIALGISVLVFGVIAAELNPDTPVSAFSIFPLTLGFAYLLVWKLQDKG